jgi:hypothetical protein
MRPTPNNAVSFYVGIAYGLTWLCSGVAMQQLRTGVASCGPHGMG